MLLDVIRWLIRRERLFRALNPLFGLYNPFLREFRDDPYPIYRRLRENAPVYRSPVFRAWICTRHEDVTRVLRDPNFSSDRTSIETNWFQRALFSSLRPEFIEAIQRNLLMLDAPDHTRIRNLVNKAFTRRVVDGLRPRIESQVEELLDAVEPSGEMNLVRDFASPLPITVIAELLGVPPEDRARFKRWSDDLIALLDPFNAPKGLAGAQDAFGELSVYLRGVFAERRRDPRDDVVSRLLAAEEGGDALTEAELISTSMIILGAGHETTTKLIGNAVLALLRNPGERKRLRDDPSLVHSAVEEFLRYDSPVQMTDRVAVEDCEIGGKCIRKGQVVVVLLGAANRDPEVFPDPDRLDLARPHNPHLSFGQGGHFCLGAQL
ncbi:MAG: cytochrome P450, partial [Myxococcota bacterium]